MAIQKRNSDMVALLGADYQKRDEPNFAVGNTIGTLLMLPELRGLWSASVVDENGALRDLAQQGRTLTNTGTAPRGVSGLVPYVGYNGTTQYHSRADEAGLDISGALTMGGWFYFTATTASQRMLCKQNPTGNQRSYALELTAASAFEFAVSTDGINNVLAGGSIVAANQWYFLAGRFTPSSEIALWVNAAKTTNTTAIPATIFNSTAALTVAVQGNISNYMAGRVAYCFLCAAVASDAVIRNLYEQTRAAFGI